VRLVSFSVDPERDSTERLRAYAGDIGADTSLWSFVTGAQGVVSQLCQTAFQLASGTLDADGAQVSPEGHSDRFVLVDRKGTIRGYYRPVAGEPEVARLLADLERLVAEGAR
jgi:cytochrome oxidase Cu insertion factor (SCO1/SenC/PrrC family)